MVFCRVLLLVVERIEPRTLEDLSCFLLRDTARIEDGIVRAIASPRAKAQVMCDAGELGGRDGTWDREGDVLFVNKGTPSVWVLFSTSLVKVGENAELLTGKSSSGLLEGGVAGVSSSSSQDKSGPRFRPPPRLARDIVGGRGNFGV